MAAGQRGRAPHDHPAAPALTAAPPRPRRRAWPVLAALAGACALLAAVLLFAVQVRTDMADFLPEGRTEAARLVLREARAGAATGLILVGIEGAPAPELARVARAVAAALPGTGLFALVAGGEGAADLDADWLQALFARRYLLAPEPAPGDDPFAEPALRAALEGLLRQLGSSVGPLAARFGLADPTGAFLARLRLWAGGAAGAGVRTVDGAWFAPGRDRALLLARTRAAGLDVPGQEAAAAAIRAAFAAAAPPPGARLLVSGPAVFALDAARAIEADVERIAVVSTVLIVALLWWRFRSPLVVAAVAVPVVLSVAAAALAVQALFGVVHGVALGFGATMLGVSVDYPVLMIGHRKAGEPAIATRRRIGDAFVLAVATAALGLAAMIFAGFPGLAQLGVFAAVGLAAAAAATWWLLPRLVIAADLAPVAAGSPAWVARVEGLRRWRALGLVPVAAAALYLTARGGPDWERDLQALSPVPAASQALDAELRAGLGAPEVGQLLVVRGPDAEAVLRRQEALRPALDALVARGALEGAEYAARLLPSAAAQEARRAALPAPEELARRLAAAAAGLPFRAGAFAPFVEAVGASRDLPPLRPADLAGTPLGARLEPLLFERDGAWQGPVALQGLRDPAAVRAAVAGEPGVAFVDVGGELSGILAGFTDRAWRWLGWSGLVVLAVLAAGLRDAARVARVAGAVLAAMLVAVAVLTLFGARLSLLHLVALQLVGGVGLDYALFFSRPRLDAEERARTLRTLVTCNAMTLLTFGLLATCETPLLRDIGWTVAVGAVLAMGFGCLWAGERARAAAPRGAAA